MIQKDLSKDLLKINSAAQIRVLFWANKATACSQILLGCNSSNRTTSMHQIRCLGWSHKLRTYKNFRYTMGDSLYTGRILINFNQASWLTHLRCLINLLSTIRWKASIFFSSSHHSELWPANRIIMRCNLFINIGLLKLYLTFKFILSNVL